MKKIFSLCFLACTFLNASLLDDKIKNIVGEKEYIFHKNLIDSFISDSSLYYMGDKINYNSVLKMLSENGLLKLKYNQPQNINIIFEISSNPLKSVKIIKDTLSSMGYSYYFTKSLTQKVERYNETNNVKVLWTINLKSEYMIDPFVFNEELNVVGGATRDIVKLDDTTWKYTIDTNNANLLNSKKIILGEKLKLTKPLNPYVFRVDNNATNLKVFSRRLNNWHPRISFYDKDLNSISSEKKERKYKGISVSIPLSTYYIKIDDRYTLTNIRRGLTVLVE